MDGVSNTCSLILLSYTCVNCIPYIPGSCIWGSKLANYKSISGLYLYLLTLSTLFIKKCTIMSE